MLRSPAIDKNHVLTVPHADTLRLDVVHWQPQLRASNMESCCPMPQVSLLDDLATTLNDLMTTIDKLMTALNVQMSPQSRAQHAHYPTTQAGLSGVE